MTVTLIEQINSLNDDASVSFLQHFDRMLVKGVIKSLDEMLASIPASVRELPEFNIVKNLAFGETKHELTEQESIELSKNVLEILGQNPVFLPLLEQAWETWESNNTLGLGSFNPLSVALAASMMVVVAASDVSFKSGDFEFHKPTVDIEKVAVLFGQFGKFVPQ